jgi:hypothetical protein
MMVTKRQRVFLAILDQKLGNISKACLELGITRKTMYSWAEKNADFREALDEVKDKLLDDAEELYRNAVQKGDLEAAKFILRTIGRKRGYGDKVEVAGDGGGPIVIKWDTGETN